MRVQHNKDFIKHLLQAKNNPNTPEEYRIAKRKVKDLVRQGKLKSINAKYEELGLSLKRIAKEIGCCIRTAQRVTNFAVNKDWVRKEHHYQWINAPHVNYREIEGYTFSTKHRLCVVRPNTYCLSDNISLSLSNGMVWYGIDSKK